MKTHYNVLVIGAGQAGLAAGYYLNNIGANYAILDKEKVIGDGWRKRYDSLVLFTPRWYSALPGLALEGNPNDYATKDEIANYLQHYAEHYSLPVHSDTQVFSLTNIQDGFEVQTNCGKYTADQIIVATGPFQKPWIPPFSPLLPADVCQVHTSAYTNPSQLQEGSVLVVGAGNSGAQIAVELSKERDVYVSVGHPMKYIPLEAMGRSVFWWGEKLGILRAGQHSRIGAWFSRQKDPIFGKELKSLIASGKIKVKPRTTNVQDRTLLFEDGSGIIVPNVIWATGFYSDFSWIHIPAVLDHNGKPLHSRGVSTVPGLYFLGLPWLTSRSSALIGGAGLDAEAIVDYAQQYKEFT